MFLFYQTKLNAIGEHERQNRMMSVIRHFRFHSFCTIYAMKICEPIAYDSMTMSEKEMDRWEQTKKHEESNVNTQKSDIF